MKNLYDDFGEWLKDHKTLIGDKEGNQTSASASDVFMRSLDNAYSLTYRPMLTEPRSVYDESLSADVLKHYGADFLNIPFEDGQPVVWTWEENTEKKSWSAQVQEAWYASEISSAEALLSNNLQFFKKIVQNGQHDLGPFSRTVIDGVKLDEVCQGEISNLVGMPQTPWFSCQTIGRFAELSAKWLKDLKITYGPYFPCHMNRVAYERAWGALYKLANTPTITIGGGWNWVSPLTNRFGCGVLFDLKNFGSQWTALSVALSSLDHTITAGQNNRYLETAPWSVCGQATSEYFYFVDNTVNSRLGYYRNCPIMTPMDSFRREFGATQNYPQQYNINLDYPLTNPKFIYTWEIPPYAYEDRKLLEYGTDKAHWGGDGVNYLDRENGQINEEAEFPEYSFAAKPMRESDGTLRGVSVWKPTDFCVPPIRLVGENGWALLYLWQSFLEGHALESRHTTDCNANTYASLSFTRPHYFKHYKFSLGGSASVFQDGDAWKLSVSQSHSIERWSEEDGGWSELSALAQYEPELAALANNEFKWINSVGRLPGSGKLPQGNTQITCTFSIPLPLSSRTDETGRPVLMFNTEWLSGGGYTEEEWNQLTASAVKIFPKTGEQIRNDALDDLSAQYYGSDGLIPKTSADIEMHENQLESLRSQYADLSIDLWRRSWNSAVDNSWGKMMRELSDFNEGQVPVEDWDGVDPFPFEHYFMDFAWTYYNDYGYIATNALSGETFRKTQGGFDYTNPCESWRWLDADGGKVIIEGMGNDIYSSPVYIDGQYSGPYYSQYDQNYVRGELSSIAASLTSNQELEYISVPLETLNENYPPLTCVVQTDQETHQQLSTFTKDEDAWKRTIVQLTDKLQTLAEDWLGRTYGTLMNTAFSKWSSSLSNDQKLSVIDEVKDVVRNDYVLMPRWNRQYNEMLSSEGGQLREEIDNMENQIVDDYDKLWRLQTEYQQKNRDLQLSDVNDGPLPDGSDLKPFMNYSSSALPPLSGDSWSMSMSFLTILPDSYNYNIAGLSDVQAYERDYYDCAQPTARWPVGNLFNTTYATSFKRTGQYKDGQREDKLSGEVSDGMMFLRSYNHTGQCFDEFRQEMAEAVEEEATEFFGDYPTPQNFYGEEVDNPSDWDIGPITLSVYTGWEEGVEYVGYDARKHVMRVSFGPGYSGSGYDVVAIDVRCINGPDVATKDCERIGATSWTGYGASDWSIKDPPANFEMYGKSPEEGVDWTAPTVTGDFKVKFGNYVMGSVNLGNLAEILPPFEN